MTQKKKLKVVVIDDDSLNVIILLEYLKKDGYEAEGFEEGTPGWNYLEKFPKEVDIVIVDKMMFTIDGFEVTRRIRKHPDLKNIPVIMQSGKPSPETLEEAKKVGINKYLEKPYSEEEILGVLNEVVKEFKL